MVLLKKDLRMSIIKRQVVLFSVLSLLFCFASNALFSQDGDLGLSYYNGEEGFYTGERDPDCCDGDQCLSYFADDRSRTSLTGFIYYTTPRGLGYNKGYGSFELLLSTELSSEIAPFIDARIHWFNNDHTAGNFGIGSRFLVCDEYVIGGNVYYDYRKTHRKTFEQIGIGAEILGIGCTWDLRANAYIPLGRTRSHWDRCIFDDFLGGFFAISERREYSFWGGDLEVGTNLSWLQLNLPCVNFYTALGPYYLASKHRKHSYGGRYRLEVNLYEYITLEGRVTYDRIFHTRGQGVFRVEIPFNKLLDIFCGCSSCGCDCFDDRMTQRVYRNEIIPVKSHCRWRTNYPITQD